jgi:hypothetical protein
VGFGLGEGLAGFVDGWHAEFLFKREGAAVVLDRSAPVAFVFQDVAEIVDVARDARVWTPLWMQAILNSGLACRVGADVYSASKCGFALPRAFMGMR